MEKHVPHYRLPEMQAGVALAGVAAFTRTALDGGHAMGLTTGEMLRVIAALRRANFYKSMTTHSDHRIWQDVYHAMTPVGRVAYIKLTWVNEQSVVQFKEL